VARRYRQGLATYKARTAASLGKSRRPPAKQRRQLLPGPATKAAARLSSRVLGPIASWPAEAVALKDAALAESLGRAGYEGSLALWDEYRGEHYKRRYREQQKARPVKPKKPSAWVRVRAHRRHRPGRAA
jgi:hypothetical protein